jgi:hypothetical protein
MDLWTFPLYFDPSHFLKRIFLNSSGSDWGFYNFTRWLATTKTQRSFKLSLVMLQQNLGSLSNLQRCVVKGDHTIS